MSPNGVVIEKQPISPPRSSSNQRTSSIGVPPRPSSRRNVFATSSTSKLSVPTPSGCLWNQRAARAPSPRGSMQTTTQLPAMNASDFCRPRFVSSSPLPADLGEVHEVGVETAAALEVVHVVVHRLQPLDPQ